MVSVKRRQAIAAAVKRRKLQTRGGTADRRFTTAATFGVKYRGLTSAQALPGRQPGAASVIPAA